jgi:DNA-directed RNA polymerase specialized sigma24 family protein
MGWLYETNKFNDKEFQNVEHWLNMLKSENSSAIQYLYAKCNKQITQVAKSYKLSNEDTEELICDCMVLFIQKLQSNEYTYQGWDPISYVIEIAKFKSLNYYRRKNKHATVELEQKETELSNGELLNCKKLIELKYLEELKDAEIIERKLTQYTTVDALKNHRSKCMKKLTELCSSSKIQI